VVFGIRKSFVVRSTVKLHKFLTILFVKLILNSSFNFIVHCQFQLQLNFNRKINFNSINDYNWNLSFQIRISIIVIEISLSFSLWIAHLRAQTLKQNVLHAYMRRLKYFVYCWF